MIALSVERYDTWPSIHRIRAGLRLGRESLGRCRGQATNVVIARRQKIV
jgi:hypothetical protein